MGILGVGDEFAGRNRYCVYMNSALSSFVAEPPVQELVERYLYMPSWGYGLIAVGVFTLLFLILMSFRNTAARYGGAAPKAKGD